MLVNDARASEFQIRYFFDEATRKITDFVSYGVQSKIAETLGGDPLPTRDERIKEALETFEGPFNEKTGLPRTREFRAYSGVLDVTRRDLRRLADAGPGA